MSVAAVPKRASESRDRIDLRVEPDLYARIDEQQKLLGGLGISAYIRLAIVERLEKDEAVARRKPPRGR